LTNRIKSTLEAIGIISKEVRQLAEDKKVKRKNCVECDGVLTHAGAYFCEECAPTFYNEVSKDDEEESE